MTIREQFEQEERSRLSDRAAKSVYSKGRERQVDACPMRTDFQRDRDRIIHCKAFRRLKYKTQVFLSPEGDHYRTRLTHTLEVAQIARTIARCLRLNEDLAEAIALGHDLGHTPFGHIGERSLDETMPEGFRHNEQSRRVADVLENDGMGLNLTGRFATAFCAIPANNSHLRWRANVSAGQTGSLTSIMTWMTRFAAACCGTSNCRWTA